MKSFAPHFAALGRSETIEAIYLVGRSLLETLPPESDLGVANGGLSEEALDRAADAAKLVLEEIEGHFDKSIDQLSSAERSKLVVSLYGYLRKMTSHDERLKAKAQSILREFEEFSL